VSSALGANIRALRQAQNLTQVELGGKLHKAGSTVRMWELGKAFPDTETLVSLSQLFGVSTDYLLSNTGAALGAADNPANHSARDKQIGKISKELTNLNPKQLKLVNDLVREISHRENE